MGFSVGDKVEVNQGRGGEEDGEKDMTAMQYLRNVKTALAAYRPWIYEGREGCLRLAREVGYCLRDSPPEERRKAWERSYNEVCVIGYGLKPPINKAEWDREVWKEMEGAQFFSRKALILFSTHSNDDVYYCVYVK